MHYKPWDYRFMEIAIQISTWSKDPSTRVGAVITNNYHQIISTGFNGFPAQIEDNERLDDRQTKYRMIIHAEMNAILNCRDRSQLKGASMYVYPLMPCERCAAHIIQAGIKHVIFPYPDANDAKWGTENQMTLDMFREAGVKYYTHFEDMD